MVPCSVTSAGKQDNADHVEASCILCKYMYYTTKLAVKNFFLLTLSF